MMLLDSVRNHSETVIVMRLLASVQKCTSEPPVLDPCGRRIGQSLPLDWMTSTLSFEAGLRIQTPNYVSRRSLFAIHTPARIV